MAIALRRKIPENGLRPLKPSKDLLGIADLIEEAFAGDMDNSGLKALQEMRWMGRWGKVLFWLDYMSPDVNTYLNGFVWEEDGKIVGNITVNRNSHDGRRWFISNVAVSKAFRGRGIARALMDAALEFVREMRGRVVLLQVRRGNAPAVHLYRSMGFKESGALADFYMPHPAKIPIEPLPAGVRLRRHRLDMEDARRAFALARMVVPADLQHESPLKIRTFRLEGSDVLVSNLFRRLFGFGTRQYWVAETGSRGVIATLNVEPGIWSREHSLGFLVHPHWQGHLEKALVSRALAYLAQFPAQAIYFRHPDALTHDVSALLDAGFEKRRTLVWMRLEM